MMNTYNNMIHLSKTFKYIPKLITCKKVAAISGTVLKKPFMGGSAPPRIFPFSSSW